jgi:predicted nuclease of predicted toxin-antitoxin system
LTFFCDEGVDRPIVDALRSAGHDVEYVAELERGIDDGTVLDRANDRNAVLVTLDKDFGELVFRQGKMNAGVLLLRLSGLSASEKARTVLASIDAHGAEMSDSFTVVAPGNVRIRRHT